MSRNIKTSGSLTGKSTGEQLIYFQAVSRANRLALPANAKENRTTGISGLKCSGLSEKFNRAGYWQKTFTGLLLSKGGWFSKRFALIWKVQALKSSRILFRLVPLAQSTKGKESGYWPTPTTMDYKGSCLKIAGKRTGFLKHFLHMRYARTKSSFPHPTLLEAMMGFPTGWTELRPSVMPSSHRSHTNSSK